MLSLSAAQQIERRKSFLVGTPRVVTHTLTNHQQHPTNTQSGCGRCRDHRSLAQTHTHAHCDDDGGGGGGAHDLGIGQFLEMMAACLLR